MWTLSSQNPSRVGTTSFAWKTSRCTSQPQTEVRSSDLVPPTPKQSSSLAEFYIACGQIKVVDGGDGIPSPLVSIPGAYTGQVRRPCFQLESHLSKEL